MTAAINKHYMLGVLIVLLRRRRRRRRVAKNLSHCFGNKKYMPKESSLGFHTLAMEMRTSDREMFFRYLSMSPDRYSHLLGLIEPHIKKKDTNMQKAISADERLTLTLRYLAAGVMQQDLSFSYRIGCATITGIIYEVTIAIWNVLQTMYLRSPSTEEEWRCFAEEFENDWNFPHCVGAIDGKHVAMECPRGTGTQYHCYKGFFSQVLLAVCDANYCFTVLDVGNYGSNNDSGIRAHSKVGKRFKGNKFSLPRPERLIGCSLEKTSYFLVGDKIFPLLDWLLKPYPGRGLNQEEQVFNYRLSRARRLIENTFGILSARWRIFRLPIRACPETVEKITLAAYILHNYLRLTDNSYYCPIGFVDCESKNGVIRPGDWRNIVQNGGKGMFDLPNERGHRCNESAVQIRNALKYYLNSPCGTVSWQLDHMNYLGPVYT